MKRNFFTIWAMLAMALAAGACQKSSPSQPTSAATDAPASVLDAKSGVTIIAPQPVSPAANAALSWGNQPLTLTVLNGVTTAKGALTYTFEVATDAGFSSKVYSADGVAQGSGTQTSKAIDKLPGSKTYYWRVRDSSGSVSGPYSTVRAFTLGPEIVLGTPTISSPSNGGTAFAPLTLTVNNISRSGPVGTIVYDFQVADSASFSNLLFDGTAAEVGGTSTTSAVVTSSAIKSGATYFWRVQASDSGSGTTTAFSSASSFVAQTFDMKAAIIEDAPPDLGSWPETGHVTSVIWDPNGILVDFDKRNGPDRWPDVPFAPGSSDTLQYTLGMCLNINGRWACSAPIQFWFGRMDSDPTAGGRPADVGREWFYGAAWGVMMGYQPAEGETVGVFAASGNLRHAVGFTQVTCPNVCERTNVALVPFSTQGAAYTLSFGKTVKALSFGRAFKLR